MVFLLPFFLRKKGNNLGKKSNKSGKKFHIFLFSQHQVIFSYKCALLGNIFQKKYKNIH